MAGIFPALMFPIGPDFLGSFVQWGPAVIGIVVGLLVAAVIRSDRLPLPTVDEPRPGLRDREQLRHRRGRVRRSGRDGEHSGFMGLSWVAVWVVLFTVVVPTSPRRALLAALASVSSVPSSSGS